MTDTVQQFVKFATPGVITAINTAWSVFRDISNIIIIGMFTFIAIATILGSVNYGAKKMISRVLIVAVLINFSLLFTKIVIDVSNFTAVQFLNAAAGDSACTDCTQLSQKTTPGSVSVNLQANGQTNGIAGAFLKYAGTQSLGSAYTAVSAVAQDSQNGGWYALLYGFIVGILEIIAAIVLLYGAILLLTRAIVFIILMLTSSIAFASYLLPDNWQKGYGWDMWREALLKNAVFAPLLAILLWVTLTIAQAFNNEGQSLGSLIPKPGQPVPSLGIEALFGYLIVIGLLFASIKISSSFASSVGAVKFGQLSVGSGALASRFIAAPIGRQLFGRRALTKGEDLSEQIRRHKEDLGKLTHGTTEYDKKVAEITKLTQQKNKADQRAKSSFNIMDKAPAKKVTKSLGLTGVLSGQTPKEKEGGVAGPIERRAKEAGEKTKPLAVSGDEQKKIREQAENAMRENIHGEKEASVAAAKEAVKATREQMAAQSPEYAQANDSHKAAVDERDKAKETQDRAIENLERQFAKSTSESERTQIRQQIKESEESRKSDMRQRDDTIKAASERAREIANRNPALADLQKKLEQRTGILESAEKDFAQITKEDGKLKLSAKDEARARQAGDLAVASVLQGADEAAKNIGKSTGTLRQRTLGWATGDNEAVGKLTAKQFREKRGTNARIRDALKNLNEDEKPVEH